LLSNFHYLLSCDKASEDNEKKICEFFCCAPLFNQHLISHFLCCLQLLLLTMPVQADDPRLYIGASVEAKAMFVTSLAECSRRFGTNAKTKVVPGVVVSFGQESTPGRNRASTFIIANFYFGVSVVKQGRLNIRSVKAVECSELHNELKEILRQRENPIDNIAVTSPAPAAPPMAANLVAQPQPTSPPTAAAATPTSVAVRTPIATTTRPAGAGPVGTTNDNGGSPTALIFHETEWFEAIPSVLEQDINGPVVRRLWSIKDCRSGTLLEQDCDQGDLMSRLDYFLCMFPPQALLSIVRFTSQQLLLLSKPATTKGEIVKFFGVIVLATKFEFDDRRSLWATTATSKYIPAPLFGKTMMSRNRFDDLWRCIRFSDQPSVRPSDMTAEQYRWKLVDDFVTSFNEHRASTFSPSERICVDESISRWYGKGGHWINHGLPMYVAIDRKPENGCEIQCASCGESGIMIRLKLVKTAEEEARHIALMDEAATGEIMSDQGLLHGAKVMRDLVLPWMHSDRIVCGDSYFASVPAATMMMRYGMRFIGVVKSATRQYPMSYLSQVELNNRGDRKGMVTIGGDTNSDPKLLAFVWMDRQRRYFIATCSSLAEGSPYKRQRWRQLEDASGDEHADPQLVDLVVPQPKAAETYYETCAMIDRHNRHRQDTLGIENKLVTQSWSMRVNLTILSMIVVDAWLAYSQCRGEGQHQIERQKTFYSLLAEELINNQLGAMNIQLRQLTPRAELTQMIFDRMGDPRAGVSVHLTPTKRRKRTVNGDILPFSLQGRCRICKCLSTFMCSLCEDSLECTTTMWICHTKKGKLCFPTHLEMCHGE
jgi:hypothetical protein